MPLPRQRTLSTMAQMFVMLLQRHLHLNRWFYVCPDRAFNKWWVNHKKRPPIPDGHVIPVLSAMQGHPESPHPWEKHADQILWELELTPTVHKPCLYSGTINGNRIIFKQQVDGIAIAAPDPQTADILLNMLNNKLTMPVKWQGVLDMFNGIDVIQTRHYTAAKMTWFWAQN